MVREGRKEMEGQDEALGKERGWRKGKGGKEIREREENVEG